MRLRRDTAFISSVLFTIALLWLSPVFVRQYLDWRYAAAHEADFGLRLYFRELRDFGFASLTIVLIGLIVTWTGYVKKARWSWFVMLVIVCGWVVPDIAYPDFIGPWWHGAISVTDVPGLVGAGFGKAGIGRDLAWEIAICLMMVVALVLPVKSVFWRANTNRQERPPDDALRG